MGVVPLCGSQKSKVKSQKSFEREAFKNFRSGGLLLPCCTSDNRLSQRYAIESISWESLVGSFGFMVKNILYVTDKADGGLRHGSLIIGGKR
ncbi:hypothetical protein [Aerosakkonema funiforme]|uniref:hypothetical protein n=1 Tax=Aerosakkonema funiforme TaxID=1246630 RepID=UPI001A7EBECA|nr:hypothetical protein [Aerosakkonema funiforme]